MYFNVQKNATVKHKLLILYSDSKATSEQRMKISWFFFFTCRIIPYAFAANTNKYFRIEKD